MVDACAAAAAATPVAEPDADPIPDYNTHPSTPARAAAGPSAAKGIDAQAEAEAPAVAPDDPNPTEAELAEARQRRQWREEHLGRDDEPQPGGPDAAGGAPEVDAEGYYEESRWYEFAVDDLAAADGAELVLTDGDGEDGGDNEEAAAADAAQGAGGAGSSRPGVYRWAESQLFAAAGRDAVGARGTAQARADGGAPAGGAGARAAGAAAAATKAAPGASAAAPAPGAPAAVAALGDAAEARPPPSSPFVVPKLAHGSPAERAAAAGARGAGAAATPDPTPNPGMAGPTSPLPLPFGGRVGARLQQMGVRASGAGAAESIGTGPLLAPASNPQATSAHRPRTTAPAGLGSGPGSPVPYVKGAAPPPASGAPSSARPQAPRTSAAGAESLAARASLLAPSPGIESHMSGAAAGADVAQVAATALAGGRPEPQGEKDGAPGETAAGAAAGGGEERARPLTTAELRDVAQRRGLSFEALVQGARKRGVKIRGD